MHPEAIIADFYVINTFVKVDKLIFAVLGFTLLNNMPTVTFKLVIFTTNICSHIYIIPTTG